MIDFLGVPLSLVNVTGWGAFTLLAWINVKGYMDGRVYPSRFVQEIRDDRDARLVEVGAWKKAWEERGVTNAELLAQNRKLLELAETSAHILKSLPIPGAAKEETVDGK